MNVRLLEYYPDLVRTARLGGLGREDAEEIAQDALVLLVQKAASREVQVLSTDSIQNRCGQVRSLRGWLRDVLSLLLKNRIRHRIRHYAHLQPLDATRPLALESAPDREIELMAFGQQVFSLLQAEEAELLRLDLLGFRSHEIAEQLEIPASTVRVRKKRMLDRLRQDPGLLEFADRLGPGCGATGRKDERRMHDADPRDENDRDDGDPRGGTGGTGPRNAGGRSDGCGPGSDDGTGKGRDMWCRNSSGDGAARIEGLLEEYGRICRAKGIDPKTGASLATPPPTQTPWGRFRAGLLAHRPTALQLSGGLVALALAILAVGSQWSSGHAPTHPLASNAEYSAAATRAVGASDRDGKGDSVRQRASGHRNTVPVGSPWVEVAANPDLPPTIQVLRAIRGGGTIPRDGHATAGGGLLQTDLCCLLQL
ncbi:MAG: sigma-70 family RNA polymerase sigma factor [Candidatus Eisenbacteria bacterium]